MVGRDSFWEPPHIMIYGGVMLAVALGFAAWRIHRNTLWRNIALALLAIPLVVAPFDEVWHAIFGKEDITSVWIIWSPPHVALVLAIVWAFVLLLPFLRKEETDVRYVVGGGMFATFLFAASFLVIPLMPEGQFHLLGWWGPVARAGLFTLIVLYGARLLGGYMPAFMIALWYGLFSGIGAGVGVKSASIIMLPHFEFPTWVYLFAIVSLALTVDLLRRSPARITGTAAGFAWGFILYGAGSYFVPTEFSYSVSDMLTAIVSTTAGGLIAGTIVDYV